MLSQSRSRFCRCYKLHLLGIKQSLERKAHKTADSRDFIAYLLALCTSVEVWVLTGFAGGERWVSQVLLFEENKQDLWSPSLMRRPASVKCPQVNEKYVFPQNHKQYFRKSLKFCKHHRSPLLAVGKWLNFSSWLWFFGCIKLSHVLRFSQRCSTLLGTSFMRVSPLPGSWHWNSEGSLSCGRRLGGFTPFLCLGWNIAFRSGCFQVLLTVLSADCFVLCPSVSPQTGSLCK